MTIRARFLPQSLALPLLLGACAAEPEGTLPGNAQDEQPFDAVGADEVVRFTGTEPFWGGEVAGGMLTWTTPDNIDGTRIAVERFAGRGGLAFSGTLDGAAFDMAVTPARCSDGMSDRTYPLVVTVQLGQQQLSGCGWSDSQPYSGGE